jgi:hypothetical protein
MSYVPLQSKFTNAFLRSTEYPAREIVADWLFMCHHDSAGQWSRMYRQHWEQTEMTPLEFIKRIKLEDAELLRTFVDPKDLVTEVMRLNDEIVRPIAHALWEDDPRQSPEYNWHRAHRLLGLL